MKHSFRRMSIVTLGAATAMLAIAGMASAQDDAVVATINGQPVTESDLTMAITDLDQQFAQLPEEQRRAAALSAIVEIRLLSALSEEKGLGDDENFKKRMELLRQRALHSAYIEDEIASTVTDEAVRARYDEEIAKAPAGEEVRARHIIVKTKEEADAIIAELDGGGDFEAIAKEKSTDGAAAQGGDLGYFAQGQMVPAFEQAAFAMEVGSYSKEPVETQFGWHVIKLEDKRSKQPPAFEQVSEQIRSLLLRETYFETVSKLREEADVEVTDPALKAAMEPAAAPAAPADGAAPAEDAEQE
ncbi:peptidylprolyl isomerase [Mesorhizobium sp. CAU 1732]|uniref:peptidylprolyl isomerase n=1 Tax=Mesorhizobium sp. CAU 1732 TaxID=3140358 RepID=UPI003260E268